MTGIYVVSYIYPDNSGQDVYLFECGPEIFESDLETAIDRWIDEKQKIGMSGIFTIIGKIKPTDLSAFLI